MVLKTFWGSLGLLLGALGGFLGVSWDLLRVSGSTTECLQNRLGFLSGLVCPRIAAEHGLGIVVGRSWFVFGAPEGLARGVLASVKTISTIKTAFASFETLSNYAT